MNWFMRIKLAQQVYQGYKVVGFKDGKAFSLYDKSEIGINTGQLYEFPGGTFLGTTLKFVIDYYTGLTDENELVLTYSFSDKDVLEGFADHEGEVLVARATLVNIEQLPKEE